MTKYVVLTGEYPYTEPVLDYGEGPTWNERDSVEVEAENKADARVLGLRLLRERRADWLRWCENPFEDMKVFEQEGEE